MVPHLLLFALFGAFTACGMLKQGQIAPDRGTQAPPPAKFITTQGHVNLETDGTMPLGELFLHCEKHIRSWKKILAQPPSPSTTAAQASLEDAFADLIYRNRSMLESQILHGEHRNRGIASATLGFSRDPHTMPLILNNVTDPLPSVAALAMFGLGVLASSATPIGPIRKVLTQGTPSLAMIENGSFALARIAENAKADPDGNLEAVFIMLIERPEANIRAQAAACLGLIKAKASGPSLANLLARDSEPAVRVSAAYALGEIGSTSAFGVLVGALNDPSALAAGTARASLAKIYGKDLGPDAQNWQVAFP